MKKNFKFLSSLALTGMLATGIMGTTFAATDVPTQPVGVYQKLVDARANVVPFVLANRDDVITVKDIKDSGKFGTLTRVNDLTVTDESKVIGTGDTFTAGGVVYTAVVYGDVDGDGAVSVLDALAIQKHRGNIAGAALDSVQLEAANVVRSDGSGVNIIDALHLQQYRAKLDNQIIDELPTEEIVEQDYNVIVNDNGVVNNVNENSSKATIQLKDNAGLTEAESTALGQVKLILVDSTGKKLADLSDSFTITPYTNRFSQDMKNLTGKNVKVVEGTNKAQLVDSKNNVLAEFEFEKSTKVLPDSAAVSTNRTATREAEMSLESKGESDVVKMYYVVKKASDSAPTTFGELTQSVNISNNKLEDAVIATNLANNTAYKVYYILENSDGSRNPWGTTDTTDVAKTPITPLEYIITKDTSNTKTETAVDKVTAPAETATKATFSWTLKENATAANGYKVTLYKDGVATYENEAVTKTSADLSKYMKEEGTYKIAVVVKGDTTGTSKDSEAVYSDEVTVTKLSAVENIEFTVDDNNKNILSWSSDYSKDDIKEYKVELYKWTGSAWPSKATKTYDVTDGSKQKEIPAADLDANQIYQAKITVVSKGQIGTISSDVATSNEFFLIDAGTIRVVTSETKTDSITLEVTQPVKIDGKETTYSVEVWKEIITDNKEGYEKVDTVEGLSLDKNNYLVVNGLDSNSTYKFKIIAKVDNVEGKSGFTATETTKSVVPEIVELTVSSTGGEGKISQTTVSGKKVLNINGVEINQDDFGKYPSEVAKMSSIMANLVNGDVVTLQGDKLTVKLPTEASAAQTSAVRDFGSNLKDMTLELEGNKYQKSIKVATAKEVILSGEGALFDIANVTADKITLKDGVELVATKAGQKVVVDDGATAIINGVKVTAEKAIEIEIANKNGKTLVVTATEGANDLTFVNTTASNADISFKGESGYGSVQSGKITINSVGGTVKVYGQNMNVAAEMVVDVEGGTVDLSDDTLGGNKDITVSNSEGKTTVVKVRAKEYEAPFAMSNVEIKDYTDEELLKVSGVTEDNIEEVRNFINSFDINGKGAYITKVETDSEGKLTVVTITFKSAVTDAKIDVDSVK